MDIYVIMQVLSFIWCHLPRSVRPRVVMGIGYASGLKGSIVKPWYGYVPRSDSVGCNSHHHVYYRCHSVPFTVTGGLDYLVRIAGKYFAQKPKHINYLHQQ